MSATFLSRFTPSMMTSQALEAVFVQRQKLAEDIVSRIRESALTASKHHTLLIGPRGIGKTHLISLIYHRLRAMDDLRDHLLIAWLREEEWGVASFLDLLLRIFRALQAEQPDPALIQRVEALYELPPDAAERAAAALLKEVIGDHTLLILAENLDDLFEGLGDEGQKRLRSYLQESEQCTTLVTAQSLFNGVARQTSPFYGFFRIVHLEELTRDEARLLLVSIASFDDDQELASFIQTPKGRARIRAIHHLAGGNHRVYVILSQFLTRQSLDELVAPFMRMLDDLTPYYQARMQWLSPQQRKIVEFLCDRRGALPVKEIAQRCFMSQQTASGQLKSLREMGYVYAVSVGRESYYELREPLMRLCVEVKKHRGEPIRLFVDFLRLWYSRNELQERLASLQPDTTVEREYLTYALKAVEEEPEDMRVTACWRDYQAYVAEGNMAGALQVIEELEVIDGPTQELRHDKIKDFEKALARCDQAIQSNPNDARAWYNRGLALGSLGRHEEALASFDKAIAGNPKKAFVWGNRSVALSRLGRYEEALASSEKALELDPQSAKAWQTKAEAMVNLKLWEEAIIFFDKAIKLDPHNAQAYSNRGTVLGKLGRYEEALASFDKAIELAPKNISARGNRGVVLRKLKRWDEALTAFDKVIELAPNDSRAYVDRGIAFGNLGRHDEALAAFDKVVELDPNNARAWGNRGVALRKLGRYEESLSTFDKAIGLEPNNALAWGNRGIALGNLGRHEEALAAFDKTTEINSKDVIAWRNRGVALRKLGRWENALLSFDKVIELDPDNVQAWSDRGGALNELGRSHEALDSFEKVTKLDPKSAEAWSIQGGLLGNLGRHSESLAAIDKAIELGEQSSSVYFNRAEALLALNRWDEGSTALDDALQRFAHTEEPNTGDTGAIIRNLLTGVREAAMWRAHIKTLIKLYDKYQVLSALGQGLVKSISALTSPMISDAAARLWFDLWQEIAGQRQELQLPLRLLEAAVRYLETEDQRILLGLPIEERTLLEPLLGLEEPSKT